MRNNLFDLINIDTHTEIVSEAKQQKEIKYKIIGDLNPYGSHQVFEIDFDNEVIRNAEIKYPDTVGFLTWREDIKNEKVIYKNNSIYYSCLNIDNLIRHIKNKFGVDVSNFKIERKFYQNGNYRKITIQDIESESKIL